MNSMLLTPDNDVFLEKSEFYSNLKQNTVSDSDYESFFFLCKTLKMRKLDDMNDHTMLKTSSYFVNSEIIDFSLCIINTALIQENVIQLVH